MRKRLLPLLVLTIVMTIAPAAMASHCERCRPMDLACGPIINHGWEFCIWMEFEGYCVVENPCGDHYPRAAAPLAADFAVASVERLDEPQTAAAGTLVAASATPAPATR